MVRSMGVAFLRSITLMHSKRRACRPLLNQLQRVYCLKVRHTQEKPLQWPVDTHSLPLE